MTQPLSTPTLRVHRVAQDDPLAAPLLAELALEYSSRYGRTPGEVHASLREYPATALSPPHGALLVVTRDGEAVAGGAFQRYGAHTAELKRIWTALYDPDLPAEQIGPHPFEKQLPALGAIA